VLNNPEVAIALNLKGTDDGDVIHTGVKDDTLTGFGGDDELFGGGGSDRLNGGDGNDKLFGQDGNDILSGGWGFDLLDGGKGIDTADYRFYTESDGLKVDLGTGEVSFRPEHSYGSPPAVEQLVSIENVIGGGGDDTLIGSSGDNVFTGGGGKDQFTVLSGNDTITDFNFNEDSLWLPSGTTVSAAYLDGHDTVLPYSGGTVTFEGKDFLAELDPGGSQQDIPWFTLGGQPPENNADASSDHLFV
jgi:Ca2+-binding RTX toxin-like protein